MNLVKQPLRFLPSPYISRKPQQKILNLHPSSCSYCSSPFTEKHSIERYQRDNWLYSSNPIVPAAPNNENSASVRENDIALQLPELKKLLANLRNKRESENGGEEKRVLGNVYLVGTGPGDPELLTLKAMRVIEKADLLLYDRLVSNDVLEFANVECEAYWPGLFAKLGFSLFD